MNLLDKLNLDPYKTGEQHVLVVLQGYLNPGQSGPASLGAREEVFGRVKNEIERLGFPFVLATEDGIVTKLPAVLPYALNIARLPYVRKITAYEVAELKK